MSITHFVPARNLEWCAWQRMIDRHVSCALTYARILPSELVTPLRRKWDDCQTRKIPASELFASLTTPSVEG